VCDNTDVVFDIRHIWFDTSHQIRVILSADIHWFFPLCMFCCLVNTLYHEPVFPLSVCLTTNVVHICVGAAVGDIVGDFVGDFVGDVLGGVVG
jgi:hypothetical protein